MKAKQKILRGRQRPSNIKLLVFVWSIDADLSAFIAIPVYQPSSNWKRFCHFYTMTSKVVLSITNSWNEFLEEKQRFHGHYKASRQWISVQW